MELYQFSRTYDRWLDKQPSNKLVLDHKSKKLRLAGDLQLEKKIVRASKRPKNIIKGKMRPVPSTGNLKQDLNIGGLKINRESFMNFLKAKGKII